MRILGLFQLSDITKERLVFKNIDANELAKRLSVITDGSTNVGFLAGGKKFHGVISQDKFRLKTVRSSKYDQFTIRGEIKRKDNDLIVDVEYERSMAMAFLPTIIVVLVTVVTLQFANNGFFGFGSLLFQIFTVGVILFILEYKREEEIKAIQGSLRGLYRPGE